ncbi:ATP-binding protein [Nocardia sp. NPDC003345]
MGVMTPSPVTGGRGWDEPAVELDLERVTPGQVRAQVRRLVTGRGGIEVCDAVQVSDELISNAVRHTRGPCTCRLRVDSGRFGVEVRDGSPAPARIRPPDDTGGRGLLLVSRLSTRWGVNYHPGGKTVWAELGDHPNPFHVRSP